MVDINEMARQAHKLHDQADHETDPKIRDRLNRMAETYDHIAKIESGNHGGSIDAMMGALTNGGRHS
jgi:hypothetical protein